jgi:hypothetical protein
LGVSKCLNTPAATVRILKKLTGLRLCGHFFANSQA